MGERPREIKERTFSFALDTVRLCKLLEGKPGISRTLVKQLVRSGTSIGANREEGYADQSGVDFVNQYGIALKEARETVYRLRLLIESGECDSVQAKSMKREAQEIAAVIGAIIAKTKGTSKKPIS